MTGQPDETRSDGLGTASVFRIDAYNPDGPWRIFAAGRDDALALCERFEDAQLILDALDGVGTWDGIGQR